MLSFFPLDVLDEIWDVIETVSEGFLTYSLNFKNFASTCRKCCVAAAKCLPILQHSVHIDIHKQTFSLLKGMEYFIVRYPYRLLTTVSS